MITSISSKAHKQGINDRKTEIDGQLMTYIQGLWITYTNYCPDARSARESAEKICFIKRYTYSKRERLFIYFCVIHIYFTVHCKKKVK